MSDPLPLSRMSLKFEPTSVSSPLPPISFKAARSVASPSLPLFGAALQQPPHPLRPQICDGGRRRAGTDCSIIAVRAAPDRIMPRAPAPEASDRNQPRQSPGRVFKGKKMCGQLGNRRCTIQSLEVVKVDSERNLLHIKGAVPGAPGGQVIVKLAVRKKNKQNKG